MKFSIIFLIVIIALTDAKNITEDAETRKIFNPKDLIPKLEPILKILREDGRFDPFDLGERHFIIDDKNVDIKIDANIKGQLKGLLGVDLIQLDANIMSQYEFEFKFPEIHLDISEYNFEGMLGGLIKIFGDGKISFKLKDLVVKGGGKIKIHIINKARFISLVTIVPKIDLNHFNFEITGYLNDDDRSTLMSKTITGVISLLIKQNKAQIEDEFAKLVMKLSEGVLIPSPL